MVLEQRSREERREGQEQEAGSGQSGRAVRERNTAHDQIMFMLEINPVTSSPLRRKLRLSQLPRLSPLTPDNLLQTQSPTLLLPSYGLEAGPFITQRLARPWGPHPMAHPPAKGYSLIQLVNLLLIVAKPWRKQGGMMSPVQSVNRTERHKGLGTTTRVQTAQAGPGELAAPWSQEGQRRQTGGEMSTWGTFQAGHGG